MSDTEPDDADDTDAHAAAELVELHEALAWQAAVDAENDEP